MSYLKNKFPEFSLFNIPLFLFAFFISISNSISAIIIILFLFSCFFIEKKSENFKKILLSPINRSIFLFYLYITISLIWSDNDFTFTSINKYSILLLIPLLDFLNYNEGSKKLSVFFFVSGILFNVIYSFVVTGLKQIGLINNLFLLKHNHYQNEFFFRGFIDHSNLSIMISFSVFILLTYLFNIKKNKYGFLKINLFIIIILLIFFLLNSYGRTGLFTLLILSPIFFIIYNPPKKYIALICSALFLISFIFISNPFKNRIQTTFNFQMDKRTNYEKIQEDAIYMADSLGGNSNYWTQKIKADKDWESQVIQKRKKSSMGKRYSIWKNYKAPIFDKILIGTGVGGVKKLINVNNIKQPHNNYIYIITEFGIIGLILFLLIFYNQLKMFFNENKRKVLKLIFPLLILMCMIINDYIIIYNTACFFLLVHLFTIHKTSNKFKLKLFLFFLINMQSTHMVLYLNLSIT